KVDLERSKATAPGRVRKRREDERWGTVRAREVVADLRPCRAAGRADLAVERVPVRVAADQQRAPADVTAASGRNFQRHGIRREGRDVGRAMDVLADLVERQPGRQLGLEATVLVRRRLRAGDEYGRDPGED